MILPSLTSSSAPTIVVVGIVVIVKGRSISRRNPLPVVAVVIVVVFAGRIVHVMTMAAIAEVHHPENGR
jgi:hypothetical protein